MNRIHLHLALFIFITIVAQDCFTFEGALPCPWPANVLHGTNRYSAGADGVGNHEGGTLILTCDEGYEIVGQPIRWCHNTTWIPNQVPYCQKKQPVACHEPESIGPCGRVHVIENNIAVYSCLFDRAFLSTTENKLHCVDGKWQGQVPQCISIETGLLCEDSTSSTTKSLPDESNPIDIKAEDLCSDPSLPSNGFIQPSSQSGLYPKGAMVHYYCNTGYERVGQKYLTCLNGKWLGEMPVCKSIMGSCQLPGNLEYENSYHKIIPSVSSGETQSQFVDHDTLVNYYCYAGYQMADPNKQFVTRSCVNGVWQGDIPQCVKREQCDNPSIIANGRWMYSDIVPSIKSSVFGFGTRIHYECNPGFDLFGTADRTCVDGFWSGQEPSCLPQGRYCQPPSEIDHGSHLCRHVDCNWYRIATEVHYTCDTGYQPVGEVIRSCRNGGVWSGPPPKCVLSNTTPPVKSKNAISINSGAGTILVAVTCCIFALLLLLSLIIYFHKHKIQIRHGSRSPPSHLSSVSSRGRGQNTREPPAYDSTLREHLHHPEGEHLEDRDRMALLPVPTTLPTYDEATRRSLRLLPDTHHMVPGEYRRLPRLLPRRDSSHREAAGHRDTGTREHTSNRDSSGRTRPDYHRSSIVTTTSSNATHDNLVLSIGSVDTMNISDGTSTTVTIDTYDSALSNPSTASQRTHIGSLQSDSTTSITTEDYGAPLIVDDSRSVSSRNAV